MRPEAWRVDDVEVLTDREIARIDGVHYTGEGHSLGAFFAFAIVDADPNDPERPPGRYWILLFSRVFMSTDDKPSAFAVIEAIAGLVDPWDPADLEISPELGAAIEVAVARIPCWMGYHPSAAMAERQRKRAVKSD